MHLRSELSLAREMQPADLGIGRLLWNMPDAVVVGDVDSGLIVLWSPSAERLFGYTAAEAIGQPLTILIPHMFTKRHLEAVARYRETGHGAVIDGHRPAELAALTRAGDQVTIELILMPLAETLVPGRFVLATVRDVSSRTAALASSERRARQAALVSDVRGALADHRPMEQILQTCAEAIVRHLDAAFARIWTVAETEPVLELQASAGMYTHLNGPHGRVPIGMFKIGLIAEECRPHLTNDVLGDPRVGDQAWAHREGMVAFAGYPLMVDGRPIGVMAMFARQPLSGDTLDALAGIADTIAQGMKRRRAEHALEEHVQELARSNAELERFAYVASHDLQEPLRAVVSYVQLLEKRYKGQLDERADKYIGYAVEGGQRMQTLINDLLAYSRVERKGGSFVPADMEAVLRRVLADLHAAIVETGASVTHDPLPTVLGDPSQLGQVLQNLIANALKFHGAATPHVHVSAQRETGEWLFGVRDNGIGIDAEYADRIFVLFQRLHGRSEYPGTGIGLAICKKIIERHGGRIWVESVPGEGATFWFTLPESGGTPA